MIEFVIETMYSRLMDDVDHEVNKRMNEETFENSTLEDHEFDCLNQEAMLVVAVVDDDDDEVNDEYLEIYENSVLVEDNSQDFLQLNGQKNVNLDLICHVKISIKKTQTEENRHDNVFCLFDRLTYVMIMSFDTLKMGRWTFYCTT